MDITIQDIIDLERESGQVEIALRLRAIVVERKVKELQAQVAELQAAKEKTSMMDEKEIRCHQTRSNL